MTLPLPTNHVFVDFENVQEIDPEVFGHKSVSFTLLLGPVQKKLDTALVEQLLNHAGTVELVRLAESGKNALDFALAFYLGRAVQSDPLGFFHIVSHDKGYDPLVEHLRHRHIRVRRHEDFSELHFNGDGKAVVSSPKEKDTPPPAAKPVPPPTSPRSSPTRPLSEHAQLLLGHLRKSAKNRPGSTTTLVRHTRSLLANKVTDIEAKSLIDELHARKLLYFDPTGKLSYANLNCPSTQ